MATPEGLAVTVKEVQAWTGVWRGLSGRDARDFGALKAAVGDGVAELGRLDIVSANAGLFGFSDWKRWTRPPGRTSSTST